MSAVVRHMKCGPRRGSLSPSRQRSAFFSLVSGLCLNGKAMVTVYSGKWTVEEERYVVFLCQQFKEGALDINEGTTLRSFLAEKLGCKPKRITKKYERTGYNGKLQFVDKKKEIMPADLGYRCARLHELEREFLESREAIAQNELPEKNSRAVMPAALFGGNAVPLNLREPRSAEVLEGWGSQSVRTSHDLPLPAGLSGVIGYNAPLGFPNYISCPDLLFPAGFLGQAPQQQAEQRRHLVNHNSVRSLMDNSFEAWTTQELMNRQLRQSSMDSLLFRQEVLLRARASMEMNALIRASAAQGMETGCVAAAAAAQTNVRLREEVLQTMARKKARMTHGLHLR